MERISQLQDFESSQTASALKVITAILSIVAGYVLVTLRRDVLPDYFLFDSDKIQLSAEGQFYGDPSFDLVGSFYRVVGLGDQPLLAGLLGYSVFVFLVVAAFFSRKSSSLSWYGLFLFGTSAIIGAVYIGGYSKDVFVLIIALALIVSRKQLLWDALIVLLMVLYGAYFRQYWVMVAVLYVLFRVLQPKLRSLWHLAWCLLGSVVLASLGVYYGLNANPDSFRSIVNEARDASVGASTVISPFIFGPQPLTGIVNNCLTAMALMVPVPLILLGGAYYLAIAAVLLLIWIGFFRSLKTVIVRRGEESVLTQNEMSSVRRVRCAALVLAFLSIQAIFEPDYGSALRHIVPLFPAMLIVVVGGAGAPAHGMRPLAARATQLKPGVRR